MSKELAIIEPTTTALVPVPIRVPTVISDKMLVRNVTMECRVEQRNPLGEANRLIVSFLATIHKPARPHKSRRKRMPATERRFVRHYVYEADGFGPEEMKGVLRDILKDFTQTVNDQKAGIL